MSITGLVASAYLRKRPVFLSELGDFFTKIRDGRGWTLRGAASIAERRGLNPPLTYQVLFRLEKGQTKNPDPEVLRAVADLYELSYQPLAWRYLQSRYGLTDADQIRHARTGKQGSHLLEGEPDVPATARRIADLERLVADYETRLREMQDVASRLVKLAALGSPEERAATRAERTRGRGNRKTG